MILPMTVSRPRAGRVALLADTHGALADGILDAMAAADLVVHAGDVGSAAILDALGAVAPVLAVRGNNDTPAKWAPHTQARLAALPEVLQLELTGGALVVVHGHQWPAARTRHARLRARWPRARLLVYGHSHRRSRDEDASPWVINPGAAGRARAHGGAGWLGLTVTAQGWYLGADAFACEYRVPAASLPMTGDSA